MSKVQTTLVRLLIEYVILTLPILIYASLEAIHHQDFWYLVRSPEWSIATIFIVIQCVRIHIESMRDGWNRLFTCGLVLVLAVVSLAAAINIYVGLADGHGPSAATMMIKWGLYGAATLLFLYVAGSALYSVEEER